MTLGPKEVYKKFCELFPNLVEDIKEYKMVNAGSILLRRKSVHPRPVYIFTYRSEKDWELIYF